jgi:GAF domain-containing protein
LQNFAAQAVIAMENARLLTETREALEQQTATAEVLQVINSSPGNLVPVFDTMLERAIRLCDAAFGILWTYDGELFNPAAVQGPAAFVEFYRDKQRLRPVPGSWLSRHVSGEDLGEHADMANEPYYREGDPRRRAYVELGGARSAISIALRKDDTLLGVFTIYRQEVRPFTDKQIALLQNFAAQAVIAIENARLITETREALEQQTATAEVLQVISSSPGDLAPVFDAMLEKAIRLCAASHGVLRTFDGELFHLAAVHGESNVVERERLRGPVRPAGGLLARISGGERVVHVADVRETDTWRDYPAVRERLEAGGVRSWIGVALRKDNTLLGAIQVYRQEVRPFSEKEIALLQNFADQAVIAMENARLLTETREALEQQTATAEVLQVINSSPGDLAPVFDAVIENSMQLCEATQGHLYIYAGGQIHAEALRGEPQFVEWQRRRGSHPVTPGSSTERALHGEQVIHIADATQAETYRNSPTLKELIDRSGIRTGVTVALRKDDAFLGTINVYRQEVRPFTEKQIALLQNFAAQAVIAIENARLLTETREALEQQTATAQVLQVINSSPGDLAPVFDAILEKALHLCEAAFGALLIHEGDDRHRIAAIRGLSPERVDAWGRGPLYLGPGTSLYRLVRGERFVDMADAADDEDYRSGNPIRRALVDIDGARTWLAVPLHKDGVLLGAFTIYRREVRPFSDKQIALVENFAAQAVIAMENARLLGELRERTSDLEESLEYQTATSDVLQVINSSPGDLGPVFDAILEKAHGLCGIVTGSLQLFDGEYFRAVAVRGAVESVAQRLREGYRASDNPITRPLLDGAQFVQIPDLDEIDHARVIASIEAIRTRTLLCVPLRKGDALLGTIAAGRLKVQPYSEKEIALIENFAAQAVIAMENARLLGELRQRTEEVAGLNRDLEARVAAQVEELGRVGRLKRFLAPQLAELIVSQGDEKILESHRREIVVVFCDLRGYTAFTETAEPEEVLAFLRQYHGALGPLVSQFEGTLDQFSGDGIMVFFNDPLPCPDPAERAVKMAMAMREEAGKLIATWRRDGCELGFGAGIAQGYATLGQIGFSERSGYTAIGTVCNLAARLCAEAKDGQILIGSRVARAVEAVAKLEDLGNLELRGLRRPVAAFNVVQSTGAADARPNLTVVARGPGA